MTSVALRRGHAGNGEVAATPRNVIEGSGETGAVFRFARTEGPGHFATFLDANRLPWKLVRLDEGEPVPASRSTCAGLGFMGGPMSANDELAWTQPVLALMRDAQRQAVPMIGHCLGGQLMARALGGYVVEEPGEGDRLGAASRPRATARPRLAGRRRARLHVVPVARGHLRDPAGRNAHPHGQHVANQGYVLDDRHLGMQCHVEMTQDMIESWLATGGRDIAASLGKSPAVQDAADHPRAATAAT